MKYETVDALNCFEFHDSVWKLAADGTVRVKALSLHRDAARNPRDCDMEIEEARMTFEGLRIRMQTPSVRGENDAAERFFRELRHGITVMSLEADEKGRYKICACGEEPYFEAELDAKHIRIEWDALRGPAWYEARRP